MHTLKTLVLGLLLLLSCTLDSLCAEMATVTISNLETTYNGTPQAVVVQTQPEGLPIEVKYNESTEIPTNAGNYSVMATITDPNYEGSASENFEIKKATAQVTISNRETTYNGNSQAVTVETTPQGIPVQVLYNGYSESLPWGAGNYSVTATITDPNYEGSESANFEIKKAEIQLEIGNLQQTFNGRFLPVSIAIAPGQSIPPEILPTQLDIFYNEQAGSPGSSPIRFIRIDDMNFQYDTSQPANMTSAGNITVQVSYDDGNVAWSGSATLVVAKGQLSDFLRVVQGQAFDYGYYGYSWPRLDGVEVNPSYPYISGINISIQNYTALQNYYLSSGYYDTGSGWLSRTLEQGSGSGSYETGFPSLSATMRSDWSPIYNGDPMYGGGGNAAPYYFMISTSDLNLEGTISVPFGIRQASFWPQITNQSYEYDGTFKPSLIKTDSRISPWSVYVQDVWRNYNVSYYGSWQYDYNAGQEFYVYNFPNNNNNHTPNGGGSDMPILPPGNWTFSVNPGGYDNNFSGGGSESVSISKKSISFRIDQPSSGENLGGGGGGSLGQVTSL